MSHTLSSIMKSSSCESLLAAGLAPLSCGWESTRSWELSRSAATGAGLWRGGVLPVLRLSADSGLNAICLETAAHTYP